MASERPRLDQGVRTTVAADLSHQHFCEEETWW